MLWSGLVSQVGASHRVNLIAPFPLEQNCPRKITIHYKVNMAAILLFLVITTCLYTKKPFSKQRMRNVIVWDLWFIPWRFSPWICQNKYPLLFMLHAKRDWAHSNLIINIFYTQHYKLVTALYDISAGVKFFVSAIYFVPELIFGIAKDWFFVLGIIFL